MKSRQPIVMFSPVVASQAIDRVVGVLHTPWIGQGNLVEEFEDAIRKKLGLPYVVAVNSSSAAIRLALSICGVKPDDEVVTTPMTCTLTNHSIMEQFAKLVFADIQYETGNIDPKDVEHRITSRTRAIVCTHWGGMPCDLLELNQIARRHGIAVIEDASEAFGATYQGKPIGTISRFTAFSFQAIQIVTTGEGGALAIQTAADDGLARMQRWYGIDRVGRRPNILGYYDFDIQVMGFGYHMTNINAALGIENLTTLEQQQKHRQMIAETYRQNLSSVAGLTLLKTPEDRTSSNHFFTIHVERREDFCRKMREAGIQVSIVHARNDEYTIFGGLRDDLPQLDRFSRSYISLPAHMKLSEEGVEYIIRTIHSGW